MSKSSIFNRKLTSTNSIAHRDAKTEEAVGVTATGIKRVEDVKNYTNTGGKQYKPDIDGSIPLPAFSGCDIVSIFIINGQSYPMYNISMISIDTNTTLTPIPTLGTRRVRRFTRGHRMIAGTINMLTTANGPIPFIGPNTIYNDMLTTQTPGSWDQTVASRKGVLIDTLPPFDIIISYTDEYGRMAHEILYGVVLFRESKAISVNDSVSEIQCSYFAMDRDGVSASQNMHKYGVDFDGIAENVVLYNNISALRIELDRLKAYKTLQPETITYSPLTNTDLATIGTRNTILYDEDILNEQINKYTIAISNIMTNMTDDGYLQNGSYVSGYREYLLNEDLLPNI